MRRALVAGFVGLALVAALLAGVGPSAAADSLVARPDWTMSPRTIGAVDSVSRYLSPFYESSSVPRTEIDPADGFEVRLDGCASEGDVETYQWRVGGEPVGPPTADCTAVVRLAEGRYDAGLTVAGGGDEATSAFELRVEDFLVVAMGDSYSSGEGVPLVVNPAAPDTGWDQDNCHRSTRGGPALAALDLEEADPRSSVTFLYVACSGATVDEGILGAQRGRLGVVEDPEVVQARALAGGRQIDALVIGVGGDDIGFARSLLQCLEVDECWNAPGTGGTLHQRLQAGLGRLESQLIPQMDGCLTDGPCQLVTTTHGGTTYPAEDYDDTPLGLDPSRVFYTEYPDLSKDLLLDYCTLSLGPWHLSADEFRWADQTAQNGPRDPALNAYPPFQPWTIAVGASDQLAVVEPSLNQQVRGSGALYGWTPVEGIYADAAPHGACSTERWVFTPADLLAGLTIVDGVAHPNHAGQTNYAANIAETAAEVLGIPVQVDPPVPVGPTTTTAPSAPTSSTSAPATAAAPAARPVAVTPAFTG